MLPTASDENTGAELDAVVLAAAIGNAIQVIPNMLSINRRPNVYSFIGQKNVNRLRGH